MHPYTYTHIHIYIDDNFRQPTFTNSYEHKPKPACYPDIYEGSVENIELLKRKIMLVPAALANKKS